MSKGGMLDIWVYLILILLYVLNSRGGYIMRLVKMGKVKRRFSKYTAMLLSLCLILSSFTITAAAAADPTKNFSAPKAAGSVVIDGLANEAGWQVTRELSPGINSTAKFGALWDDTNLYIAVNVIDANVINNNNSAPFLDDSVEVYIDGSLSKTYDSPNTVQYIFRYNDPVAYARRVGTPVSEYTANIKHTSLKTTDGYSMEIAIPWASIGGMSAPAEGGKIGITVHVNDEDDNITTNEPDYLLYTTSVNGDWCDASNWAEMTLAAPAPPQQATSIVYDFRNLGLSGNDTQPGWTLVEADSSYSYSDNWYGFHFENYETYQTSSRHATLNFDVPETGAYELLLKGYLAGGGAISDILVDDQKIGQYDFYAATEGFGNVKSLKTLQLTQGTHTLTLRPVDRTSGSWGYCMYPSEFTLVGKAGLPVLQWLTVTSDKEQLLSGQTAQLTVTGKLSDGNIDDLSGAVVTYASDNKAAATVDANGLVTAVAPGTANITVTATEGGTVVSKTIQITVFDIKLDSIAVTSDKTALSSGDTAQLSVTGTLNTGNPADLSSAVIEFTSSDTNIATVDNASKTLTAVGAGTATITAKVTLNNVVRQKDIQIKVYAGKLQSVIITTPKTKLEFLESVQLSVKGIFSDGVEDNLDPSCLTFTSSDDTIVKADAKGSLLAIGEGNVNVGVTAVVGSVTKTGTITITVYEAETIIYDFHKLGVYDPNTAAPRQETMPCWEIADTSGGFILSQQPYGLQVENDSLGGWITFRFHVPVDSPYQIKFRSALATGGGIASLKIDDTEIRQYDFYNLQYILDSGLIPMKTMMLTKGDHIFKMQAIGYTPPSWGYRMYPGQLVLVKKDSIPVLTDFDITASRETLVSGQTSQVRLTGKLSDGTIDNLSEATITYASDNEAVAAVDGNGTVRAVGAGTVNITATVKLGDVQLSKSIQLTVGSETLKSVALTCDKTALVAGQTAKISVTGTLTNDKPVDLSDAAILYSSDNAGVATVDSNGTVKALGEGVVNISASVILGGVTQTGSLKINIEKLMLKEVTLALPTKELLTGGKAKLLTVTGTMNDGSLVALTQPGLVVAYTSDNPDIASVDQNGIVTPNNDGKEGNVTITVDITLDNVTVSGSIRFSVILPEHITNSKTGRSLYTDAKVAAARENIEKYSWAKALKDQAVAQADKYIALGNEFWWNIVSTQNVPRSFAVNQEYGCPICGKVIYTTNGSYPWIMDPVKAPWKLECPVCSTKFPTNDFEAYYKGGLDVNGNFDPVKAKAHNDELIANGGKGNLVNVLYPDKPENWGVDDGYGFIDNANGGKKYTFIAYYNHWGLWYNVAGVGIIQSALDSLRDAYLYTGDEKYARTGTILLDRIADIYPDMDLSKFNWNDGFLNSHGGTGLGKVLGSIWETVLVPSFIRAYDAFYPGMDDQETISFLSAKSAQYKLENPKTTAAAIRRNIEDNIVRQVVPGVKNCQLEGNTGMHQSCVALAAVVLNTFPETKDWLDFDFKEGELLSGPRRVTGGDILPILVNEVDRDGQGNEAAPHYNYLWLDQLGQVADVLDGYEGYQGADLYKNPKYVKMLTAFYPLILSGRYSAQIGDSGATGDAKIIVELRHCIKGFEKTGDPVLAQLAYYLNSESVNGLHNDIFTKDPEAIQSDIQNVINTYGTLKLKSTNLTGFGYAVLRDGENFIKPAGINYNFGNMNIVESTVPTKYFDNSSTVQFEALTEGQHIKFSFDVPKTDEYEIDLKTFKATSYGIYDILIDGEFIMQYDFYSTMVGAGSLEAIGKKTLAEGTHTIEFVNKGKNPAAENSYKMGVIQLSLLDKEAQAIRDTSNEKGDTQRDVWMYYGRNFNHGHKDTLNLGMHAFGIDVAPELGYPERTGEWPHRLEWSSNTISHNTVVVDKAKQSDELCGQPQHFDDSGTVKLMDVEAPQVYPQTEMYRRTVAMIKVDDTNSYAVDLFRVKGGTDHYYSFHSNEGTVTTEGLNLVPQMSGGSYVGTYAGSDIDYAERYDSVAGWGYMGSGFHYLKNVDRDGNPSAGFSVDWKIDEKRNTLPIKQDVHLKLTMLNELDDVALADGVPPQTPGNPATLKYLVAHRKGNNLNSLFTAILQPYRDNPFIESSAIVPVKAGDQLIEDGSAVAVKVVLKNGRTDYIINALNPDIAYTVDGKLKFKGFFGVYSIKDGNPVYAYMCDGNEIGNIRNITGSITGKVVDFTKNLSIDNQITVQLDEASCDPGSLAGRYIYVENDGQRNASYRILGASVQPNNTMVLNIGGTSLIRKYVDSGDFSKGFVYDLAEGAAFRIPLSKAVVLNQDDNSSGDNDNNYNVGNSNTGDKTIITVKGELGDNGSVNASVTADQLTDAFGKTKEDSDGVKVVTIKIGDIKGAKQYVQQLPANVLTAAGADKRIEIETPFGTIIAPSNMLTQNVIGEASTVELCIGLAEGSTISEELKAAIGKRPVIELSIRVDGKTIDWNNPEAPITISVDYTPTAEELKDPEHIVVLYIDGNGNAVPVLSGKYSSVTGRITFKTTHFSKYAVAYIHKTFNDTAAYSWAEKQIGVLASKGVLNGTSRTTFAPGENISRADFIMLLVKALGLTAKVDSNFNDVSTKDYYYEAVGIARKLGITSGVGVNRFNPKASITRQDMMVMVDNALKIAKKLSVTGDAGDLAGYSDASKIAAYAEASVANLVKDGIIQGSGGRINPLGNATRAEAAVIMYKIYNK